MLSWSRVLLTYPEVPGTPAMDAAPMRKKSLSSGLLRPQPRITFRSSEWVPTYTTPADTNRTSLIRPWFIMCRTVPHAASASSAFKNSCIARPTRMKPICDMDEQASARLRLTENSASTAPRTIVAQPSARITIFHS